MALELVVFDCDGVLVDSVAIDIRELTRTIARLGGTMSEHAVRTAFDGAAIADIERVLAAHLGAPPPADWMQGWFAARTAAFERDLTAVPGAAEAVDTVRTFGWDVCVASQGEPEKLAQTLRVSGLAGHFGPQRIFSATMVARGKPAPDLFLHAAARMGFDPAATTVVEDSSAGVRAGVAAGMRVVGYAGGVPRGEAAALHEAGAAATLTDLACLPALLGIVQGREKA